MSAQFQKFCGFFCFCFVFISFWVFECVCVLYFSFFNMEDNKEIASAHDARRV